MGIQGTGNSGSHCVTWAGSHVLGQPAGATHLLVVLAQRASGRPCGLLLGDRPASSGPRQKATPNEGWPTAGWWGNAPTNGYALWEARTRPGLISLTVKHERFRLRPVEANHVRRAQALNRTSASHTMRYVTRDAGTLEPNARRQGRLKNSVQRSASRLIEAAANVQL